MNDRIEKLKSYLLDSPNDAFLKHALALEYVKMGDNLTAVEYFNQNQENQPDYVATYYHLAKAHERLQERENAIKIYEEGMKRAKAAGDMHSYNELQNAYEDFVY